MSVTAVAVRHNEFIIDNAGIEVSTILLIHPGTLQGQESLPRLQRFMCLLLRRIPGHERLLRRRMKIGLPVVPIGSKVSKPTTGTAPEHFSSSSRSRRLNVKQNLRRCLDSLDGQKGGKKVKKK